MTDRRDFIKQTGLLSLAGIIGANQISMAESPNKVYDPKSSKWADGSRLVVSATMLLKQAASRVMHQALFRLI